MNNYDDNSGFVIFIILTIVVLFSLTLGGVLGYANGEADSKEKTRKETVNYCVTSPEKCKIEYEFYKLQSKSEK